MNPTTFNSLLTDAITRPGILSDAYSVFRGFSISNMCFAYRQLEARNIAIGPIATFKKWQQLGRTVKKGERAISLCMPVSIPKTNDKDEKTGEYFQIFVFKNRWFALAQTEGQEYVEEPLKGWDYDVALAKLGIKEIPFDLLVGNAQGFARRNEVSINPLAKFPHKTRFHEIAHVVLGHTATTSMSDDECLNRDIAEVEAESVAYICCSILGLTGLDESRGYIQSWLSNQKLPEKSAQKIFTAANKIMQAGGEGEDEGDEIGAGKAV